MIELEPRNLSWIQNRKDDPQDKCAHASVSFVIQNTVFVSPDDGDWTVSASALYLLRALTFEHHEDSSVTEGNLIFPCCAFNGFALDETNQFPLIFFGCPNGIDISITHQQNSVTITSKDSFEIVPKLDWFRAVIKFVDMVINFHQSCSEKIYADGDKGEDDRQLWEAYWQELLQRRELAMLEL